MVLFYKDNVLLNRGIRDNVHLLTKYARRAMSVKQNYPLSRDFISEHEGCNTMVFTQENKGACFISGTCVAYRYCEHWW